MPLFILIFLHPIIIRGKLKLTLENDNLKFSGTVVKGLEWIGDAFVIDIGCYFLLGRFYVKFAPSWPLARECLVGLCYTRPSSVIPQVLAHMQQVNRGAHNHTNRAQDGKQNGDGEPAGTLLTFCELLEEAYHTHLQFHAGSTSTEVGGVATAGQIANSEASGSGTELQGQHTENLSVLGQLWGVLERLWKVLESNSRAIVSMFFSFLVNEHFQQHKAVETSETQSLVRNMQLFLSNAPSQDAKGLKQEKSTSATKSGSFRVTAVFLDSAFSGTENASEETGDRNLSAKVVSRNLLGFLKIVSQVSSGAPPPPPSPYALLFCAKISILVSSK
jgi:hypothetical protein